MTIVKAKYRGTKEFLLAYMKLITAAQYRGVVYYTDIAKILGIEKPGHHMGREVGQLLGEISENEHQAGRPMLSAVARKNNLAAVITNQVYPLDGDIEPVGGSILKYWSKAIVELTRKNGRREAILRRHRSMEENARVAFAIEGEGIRDGR